MMVQANIVILSHLGDYAIDGLEFRLKFVKYLVFNYPNTLVEIDPDKEFAKFEAESTGNKLSGRDAMMHALDVAKPKMRDLDTAAKFAVTVFSKLEGRPISQEDFQKLEQRADELTNIYEDIQRELDSVWFAEQAKLANSGADHDGLENMNMYREAMKCEGLMDFRKLLSMLDPEPSFSEIPGYGDVMTIEHFVDNVNAGGFIDYDGYGNYTRDGKMSDIEVYPSTVKRGFLRKDMDGIVWFNR